MGRRKKCILGAILVVLAAGVIYAASVTEKAETGRKQYSFALEPGDRVIVVKASCTRITVTPTSSKVFELKIPAGKRMNGQLILN